ncbi:hypothetical protein LXL04_014724 [Taraxacum kok-saghyz]
MATIKAITARQVFDGCGNPTLEVDVTLSDNKSVRFAVSSDSHSGIYDGGSDYLASHVCQAVDKINTVIGPALVGKDPTDQTGIDNFILQQVHEHGWCSRNLGANATMAVSAAVCKAGAKVLNIPLYQHIANLADNKNLRMPVPTLYVVGGGSHVENKLIARAFSILPVGADSFKKAMGMGVEVYHNLKSVVEKKFGQNATNVGDEGGFSPKFQGYKEVLEALETAIDEAGYTGKVLIGIDVAASEFYGEDKTYDLNYKKENIGFKKRIYAFCYDLVNSYNPCKERISGEQLKDLYKLFVSKYPVASIEDPFAQDDLDLYAMMTAECGDKVQIVGDNLLLSNPNRLKRAIEEKTCNALLLKVDQIRTMTEIIEAVKVAKDAGWGVIASHCSGETDDTFIADLSVGLGMGQIKTGAPCRSEHLAKYNQLLRIEEELGKDAVYAGRNFCKPICNVESDDR